MRAVGHPMGWRQKFSFKQAVCHMGHCFCSFLKLPWEPQGSVSSHTAPDGRATASGYTATVPKAAVPWNPTCLSSTSQSLGLSCSGSSQGTGFP